MIAQMFSIGTLQSSDHKLGLPTVSIFEIILGFQSIRVPQILPMFDLMELLFNISLLSRVHEFTRWPRNIWFFTQRVTENEFGI